MTGDLTCCIVSYNTRDLLRVCLQSLLQCALEDEVRLQVVVVDNGSSDESCAMVRREFPAVTLLTNRRNEGYGAANNQAAQLAAAPWLLILNSDTEMPVGTLRALLAAGNARPAAGALGPRLQSPDGSPQISCGGMPDLRSVFFEQLGLDKLRWRATGGYMRRYALATAAVQVAWVAGTCLLVRTAAFRETSGFDTAFFMYFEDTDLCLRLAQRGYQIWYLPEISVLHHQGASSREARHRARMIVAYNASRYLYFTRHAGRLKAFGLQALVLMGAGLRLLCWSLPALGWAPARRQVRIFREVWTASWRLHQNPKQR